MIRAEAGAGQETDNLIKERSIISFNSLNSGYYTGTDNLPPLLLLVAPNLHNSISLFGDKRIKTITRWWQAGQTTVELLINDITDNRWAAGCWLPNHLLLSKIITQNILTPRPPPPPPPPHLLRSPAVLLWIKLNNIWSSWQGKHGSKYLISRPEQTEGGHEQQTQRTAFLSYWVKRQREITRVSDHPSPWARREIDLINLNCSVTKLINQSYHKTHKGYSNFNRRVN